MPPSVATSFRHIVSTASKNGKLRTWSNVIGRRKFDVNIAAVETVRQTKNHGQTDAQTRKHSASTRCVGGAAAAHEPVMLSL